MKTIWSDADRAEIRQRLSTLQPAAPARWGRMDAPQAVTHLANALRMALGELPVAPKYLPIRYFPLKQLIIYVLPFPKGAPTAPELLTHTPGAFAEDLAQVDVLLERLAQLPEQASLPEHPVFGRLTRQAWGVLVYRHTAHHLTQFGA